MDVFTRKQSCDIVLDSLRFCQKEKGLIIYRWGIMSNHIHLIAKAKDENLGDILRDFKKFTAKQMIKAIRENEKESRREWMLRIFNEQGVATARNKAYPFWWKDNQPKECYSPSFSIQRMNSIHQYPVEAGLAEKADDYFYSSSSDYVGGEKTGLLEIEFL